MENILHHLESEDCLSKVLQKWGGGWGWGRSPGWGGGGRLFLQPEIGCTGSEKGSLTSLRTGGWVLCLFSSLLALSKTSAGLCSARLRIHLGTRELFSILRTHSLQIFSQVRKPLLCKFYNFNPPQTHIPKISSNLLIKCTSCLIYA